uniref:START domain-containing protein n=1 Tax=Populus davidiana TaxID=266767 RepID=A0A6M2F7W8_9ROSI
MGKSGKISQYRERLDQTLASPELTNLDALKTLIKNQLVHSSLDETEGCSDNLIENRTKHVSSFLDMLRSASVSENEVSRTSETSHGGWKIKEDHEEFRVMYRPGPQGTPFHSLLVEGYVDGTVDTCLCVSWEATLYRKWWPQYSFPPFRITICECLQRIRIGEQISLVRVKVAWPLTARETVVHYVLFEYLQDGLFVVVASTISDLEGIDKTTHGFSKDGIPEAKDVVRIDVMGGFAIQKVTSERSYFRTIANVDLKLDFVPPSLINFISRQLLGNGFRLYQKVVASVSNYDEDYSKALKDPMYARIREALYSTENADVVVEGKVYNSDASILQKEHSTEDVEGNLRDVELNIHGDNDAIKDFSENAEVVVNKSFSEIEEENNEESRGLKDENLGGLELNNASKAFPYSAPLMDSKSCGEIKEDNDPESRHSVMEGTVYNGDASLLQKEHSTEDVEENLGDVELNIHGDNDAIEGFSENAEVVANKSFGEIEEENNEENRGFKDENLGGLELNNASKAFPYSAPLMDNKSFGEIKEENDPESRHLKDRMRGEEQRVHCKDHGSASLQNIALATDRKTFIGIEEEKNEYSRHSTRDCRVIGQPSSNKIALKSPENCTRNMRISSDVGRALETLEKAISVVREYSSSLTRSSSSKTNEETPNLEKDVDIDPTHLEDSGVCPKAGVSAEVSDKGRPVERNSHESRNSSSNLDIRHAGSRETNHYKVTPESPDQYISVPNETNHVALYSSQSKKDGTAEVQTMDITAQGNKQTSLEANGIHENVFHEGKKSTRQKSYRYCCFGSRYE